MRVWDGMDGRALAQPFPQPPLCFSLSLPLPHLKSAMLAAVMPHLKVGAWVKCRGVRGGSCERVALQAAWGRGSRARTSPCPPPFSLSSPPPSHPEVDRLRPGRVVPKGAQTAGQSGGGLGRHEGLEAAARRGNREKGRRAARALG